MTGRKESAYDELAEAPASTDKVRIIDVSDTSGTGAGASGCTKWATVANFFAWLLATARTFTAAPVVESSAAAPLKIRQPGGTAGDDEVWIYNDGSHSYIDSKNGSLYLYLNGVHIANVQSNGFLVANGTELFFNSARPVFGGTRLTISGGGLTVNDNDNVTSDFITGSKYVLASTAGVGSPRSTAKTECRLLFTNEGSTARNYHNLPSAEAGFEYEFYAQDSDGMQITAAAGDLIRFAGTGTATATAGFIRLPQYAYVKLVAINADEWIVTSVSGTPTVDS